MSISPSTEIIHPELGAIRFDDGKKSIPGLATKDKAPKWVCHPDGWRSDSDFEIYLPGDALAPKNLDRALAAFRRRAQLEEEGKELSSANVSLAWIDLTTDPPSIAFPDNDHVYVIWKGSLNENLQIGALKQEAW